MYLALIAGRDQAQKRREQGRPALGEVNIGYLANRVTGGSLDLAILNIEGDSQDGRTDLFLDGVGNGNGRALVALTAPVPLNKLSEGGEGSLSNLGGDGIVAGDIGEGEGKCGIGLGILQIELGLFSRALGTQLCVGKDLHELVLHIE